MIVAGFGFRAAATRQSLADALDRAGRHPDLAALATVTEKVGAPALNSLATELGLPVVAVDSARLAAQQTATHSAASLEAHGSGSVAEAAALAAVGRHARLLAPRSVSADRMATCALAEGDGS